MDALILAAGRGSRLGTRSPKCLADVAGRALVQIQIDNLRRAGVENVTIVVGYRHEEVRAVASDATFILNERFAETNSLYSFSLASSAVTDDLVVLNADVLFPQEMLSRLVEGTHSALAFDSHSGEEDEHMKVHLRDGRLVRMCKKLPPALTAGENVGLVRLRTDAVQACFDAAAMLVRNGHEQDWVGAAISAVAASHPISGVDVRGLPWVEIDYPEDLAFARSHVWAAIKTMEAFAQRDPRPPAAWSCDVEKEVAG